MSSSLSVNTFKINVKSFQNKEAEDFNMRLQPSGFYCWDWFWDQFLKRFERADFGLTLVYITQGNLSSLIFENDHMNVVISNMNL